MFENIINFFKKIAKKDKNSAANSKDTAKERLHLVLMQDRANVSVDFLELMKQEIIDVIKKYIDVDESAIDVRLTNKENDDGTNGAPALYANIPIINIKNETRKIDVKDKEEKNETKKVEEEKETKNENKEVENENKQEIKEKQEGNGEEISEIIIDNGKEEKQEESEEDSKSSQKI